MNEHTKGLQHYSCHTFTTTDDPHLLEYFLILEKQITEKKHHQKKEKGKQKYHTKAKYLSK